MGCSCISAHKKQNTISKSIQVKGRTLAGRERVVFRNYLHKSNHIKHLVINSMDSGTFSRVISSLTQIDCKNSMLLSDSEQIELTKLNAQIDDENEMQYTNRANIQEFPNKQFELKIRNLLIDDDLARFDIKGDFSLCQAITNSLSPTYNSSFSLDCTKLDISSTNPEPKIKLFPILMYK